MKNEFLAWTPASLFSAATQDYADRNTLATGDIRRPWQSVYGFTRIAAQLAAGQKLILQCREDEIFELMAALNDLLKCPRALHQAYGWLQALEAEYLARLLYLLDLGRQSQRSVLPADIAHTSTGSAMPASADCLESTLDGLTRTIAGLKQSLVRQQVLLAALTDVKDKGFHAVVYDRRRQPTRPSLEARRNEPVLLGEKPTGLPAGFLLPTAYHLTLWGYLVRRSDDGQATIWN